jgi:histidyl-tRNA synthetase
MRVARQLWNSNISAEYSHLDNPKLKKQLDDALERQIPYMVIIGKDELVMRVVKVKNMLAHTEEEISIDDVATYLIAQGCTPIPAGCDVGFLQMMKN